MAGTIDAAVGPQGVREGQIVVFNQEPGWNSEPFEIIERKGIGHPDSITDALSCLLSLAYSRYTLDNFGMILHHQFDKVMLIGGKTEVSWGGGRFVDPIRLIIAGRASTSYGGQEIPVKELAEKVVHDYFARLFYIPDISKDLIIEQRWTNAAGPGTLKESSGPISRMFEPKDGRFVRGYGSHYVANDTSFCTSYSPLSRLEETLLSLERHLNSPQTKQKHPWLGTDIKIMGVRAGEQFDITSCIPQIARYVGSAEEYQENLATIMGEMEEIISQRIDPGQARLSLNTKDNPVEKNFYLTVSGSSLSGDIGATGRGNRVNGLITSSRPMSLEGTSGKNPRYYAGFIYALASRNISERLYQVSKNPNTVAIVSQNGAPLLDPWYTVVTTRTEDPQSTQALVEEELASIPKITQDFVDGKIITY